MRFLLVPVIAWSVRIHKTHDGNPHSVFFRIEHGEQLSHSLGPSVSRIGTLWPIKFRRVFRCRDERTVWVHARTADEQVVPYAGLASRLQCVHRDTHTVIKHFAVMLAAVTDSYR